MVCRQLHVSVRTHAALFSAGDEAIMKGLSLSEWANLVYSYGAVNAVNLDGGGSSVVVDHNKVVSQPSDYCNTSFGRRCERAVATIICIK